jgi:hypothetical protein
MQTMLKCLYDFSLKTKNLHMQVNQFYLAGYLSLKLLLVYNSDLLQMCFCRDNYRQTKHIGFLKKCDIDIKELVTIFNL